MRFFTGLHQPSDAQHFDAAFIERFETRINPVIRAPELGECWEWTGAKNDRGYGQTSIKKKVLYAHRVALEIATGKPLGKLRACHRCDNPVCVRPEHLFAGTQKQNLEDMARKGRGATGEHHGRAKLNQAQVNDIRRRHAAGESAKVLAAEFAVHPVHLADIVRGAIWKERT